jgi:hypothetical protein
MAGCSTEIRRATPTQPIGIYWQTLMIDVRCDRTALFGRDGVEKTRPRALPEFLRVVRSNSAPLMFPPKA